MRKRYYELTAPVKPGFSHAGSTGGYPSDSADIIRGGVGGELVDSAEWKFPPHIALANLGYPGLATRKDIIQFIRTYGAIVADIAQRPEPSDTFEMSITEFRYLQEQLRRTWKNPTTENLKYLWLPRGADELTVFYIPVLWTRRIELRPSDVWTYIRLILARDIGEGLARYCANENCKHPYFVANRKDRKCCSAACRNARNQRNFQRNRRRHGK